METTRPTVIHREPSVRSPRGAANSKFADSVKSPRSPPPPPERASSAAKRPSYYSYYSDKPLPDPGDQRPGTAGTEAALKINIRRASEQLRQAQQAERMYHAMKRAAAVHANRTESKAHFQQSVEHLQLGVRKGFLGVVGFPHILREKYELRRQKAFEAANEKRARKYGKLAAPEDAGRQLEGGQPRDSPKFIE